MKTVVRQRQDVVNKLQSNPTSRDRAASSRRSSFDIAREVLQDHEHENQTRQ